MDEREKLLLEIKGLIADSQKEGVKKADLDKTIKDLNDKIAQLDNGEMKALKESVDGLLKATAETAAAVKAMGEVASKNEADKPMTFKQALIEAAKEAAKNVPSLLTEVQENGEKRLSMKDYFKKLGHKNSPEMTVKIAVDMLQSAIVQSNVNTIRLTDLDPQRVGVPLTIYQHVTDWMPTKSISKKFMSVLVVYSYEDGAGTKTQGSAPSQSSFLFKTVEFVGATIATYFTLSDESLDDLPEAMDEISIVAPSKIKDNVDYQILGSAGDDTTTLKGLYAASKHTDFASATTYAGYIPGSTSKVDAIALMKLQNETAGYPPNVVILNPTEIVKIAAEKDQLDNSKTDRRVVFDAIGNPTAVCGLLIKTNSKQTANTATVLDSTQVQIGDRKSLTLEIGYNGTDFTEGQKTVKISVRLAFAVRNPLAVTYCDDLAAAVTAISGI